MSGGGTESQSARHDGGHGAGDLLDGLLGAIGAGVCMLDAHDRVCRVNPAWLAMIPQSAVDVLGRDIGELSADHSTCEGWRERSG